jgi:tRNA nucleotidyltransferase (CCA-adding enzyme)
MQAEEIHISAVAIDAISRAGSIYEVGGVVRDRMLNIANPMADKDYLVCGVPIDDLIKILRETGRVDVVGKSFGVIKYTEFSKGADGEKVSRTFDIALPRVEKSTGSGHKDFEVDFDPSISIEEDLCRRDFTVNAMAESLPDRELIDPYGGRVDLEKRVLRIVSGDSFIEDPLRMLRGVQFVARFELTPTPETLDSMRENAALMRTISAERVAEELNKLLSRAAKPSPGLRLMQETGLLRYVIPELVASVDCDQPGPYHRWDVFEHTLQVIDAAPARLRLRLACLFHDIEKPRSKRVIAIEDRDGPEAKGATFYGHEALGAKTAEKIMKRLRYSRELTEQVSMLVDKHMFTTGVTPKGLRRLVRKVGLELIFDLLDLRRADVAGQGMGGKTDDVDEFERDIREELERKPPFSRSDLALNGHDIMLEFGLVPGPTLGAAIDHLMEKVLDNPEDNTAERLREFVADFLSDSGE